MAAFGTITAAKEARKSNKARETWEYGDFQTPPDLAEKVCQVVRRAVPNVGSIVEPCCGIGGFVLASAAAYPDAKKILGVDRNEAYIQALSERIENHHNISTLTADFFTLDWGAVLAGLPNPLLIIGNPPWVTSADLGKFQSENLPQKSNFLEFSGFEALTGKSNFDISEWMLLQHLDWLKERGGTLAMLVKTSVARKVLTFAWKQNIPLKDSKIYQINAMKHFGAAVDACLFILQVEKGFDTRDCDVYETLEANSPVHTLGYHDGILVNDSATYQRLRHLSGVDLFYKWRSGIKHDSSKVMELERSGDTYQNGFGETVALEETYLYPLYKSSDVGNEELRGFRKHVIATQKKVGGDTAVIKEKAPKTWSYLISHQVTLDSRKSSIYKGKPPFSIFGVGDYTFAPWKVVISGLYKQLDFKVVPPIEGKATLVDDTINFLPCYSEEEADFVVSLLNSQVAKEFYSSMIFWQEKRPITINLLKRLDIQALARSLGVEEQYLGYAEARVNSVSRSRKQAQLVLYASK